MKKFARSRALFGTGVGLAAMLVATAVSAQENIEQGKILFESRCPLCHQVPEPSMLKLEQWRRSLHTMQKRMQQSGMSPLSETEFQQVLAFLATQARD